MSFLNPDPRKPYNCWIDPKGKVHPVGLWGHAEWAYDWVLENEGRRIDVSKATEYLHENGWARVFMRSEVGYAQVIANQRPTKAIYEGVYSAYLACDYREIWEWLRNEGYIEDRIVNGEA